MPPFPKPAVALVCPTSSYYFGIISSIMRVCVAGVYAWVDTFLASEWCCS